MNEQSLIQQLEALLIRQIQSAQRNDFSAVAENGKKVDDIIGQIAGSGLLETEKYRDQRRRIEKLYQKLGIIVATEEKCTANQLKQVRAGSRFLNNLKLHNEM